MFNASRRDAAVTSVTDPAVVASVRAQFDESYTANYAKFGLDKLGRAPAGQTLVAISIPAGTHVVTFTPSIASVAVWSTGLIGLAGENSTHPVAEAWSTATMQLCWDGKRWRWLSGTQVDGPTPVPGLQAPSTATAIAAAIKEFGGPES